MASSLFLATTTTLKFHGHGKLNRCKTQVPFSCRSISRDGSSSDPSADEKKGQEEEEEERFRMLAVGRKVLTEVQKVRETLSPKQKGDWKDLLLMSLSFAIYVYMSQKIVCAYCAWMAILNRS